VTDTAGSEHHTSELEDLIEWADVVAILTAHDEIDWMTVFQRASLIVDTVNRSASMAVKPRQVLRLGAGWSQG
jgi:UDP-N-acetyl-D-mannosaminuronate dehydrogenase